MSATKQTTNATSKLKHRTLGCSEQNDWCEQHYTGVEKSGIFMWVRPMPSALHRLPDRLLQLFLKDPALVTNIKALELYIANVANIPMQLQEVEAMLAFAFKDNWHDAKAMVPCLTEQRCLRLRIDVLELLLQSLSCDFMVTTHPKLARFSLRQYMIMWMSAHVPLWLWHTTFSKDADDSCATAPWIRSPSISKCFGVHWLPDMSAVTQNLDYNNLFGSKTDMPSALAHIMSKALPRRCQIRELSRFLLHYFHVHPGLQLIFDRMLALSLLGLYPLEDCIRQQAVKTTSTTHAMPFSFTTIASICVALTVSNTDSSVCLNALKSCNKKQTQALQALFFYLIRELLMYQLQLLPGLKNVLRKQSLWFEFECTVHNHMQQTRQYLHILETEGNYSGISLDTLNKLALYLQQTTCKSRVNANQLRSMSIGETLSGLLVLVHKRMERIDRPEWELNLLTFEEFLQDDRQKHTGLISRISHSSAHQPDSSQWRHSQHLVHLIFCTVHKSGPKATEQLISELHTSDAHRFYRFHHEVLAASRQLNTGVYSMPQATWIKQILCIDKRWKAAGLESTGSINLHCNAFIYCRGCGEIKNSFSKNQDGSHRKKDIPTQGSVDVTVDDDKMLLMCSKANDKEGRLHATTITSIDEIDTVAHDDAPSLEAYTLSDVIQLHCNTFSLQQLHLPGNVIFHNNSVFCACVDCAIVTELNHDRMGSFRCLTCHNACLQQESEALQLMQCKVNRCAACNTAHSMASMNSCVVLQAVQRKLLGVCKLCNNCNKAYSHLRKCSLPTLQEIDAERSIQSCQRQLRNIGFNNKRSRFSTM